MEQKLLRNLSTSEGQPPSFDLANLLPGKRLMIKIYSANNKGRSEKTVELESSTSKVAELQIDTAAPASLAPRLVLVAALSAGVLVLLLCSGALLIVHWLNR